MAAWPNGGNVTVLCTLVLSLCLPSAAEITGMMRVRRTNSPLAREGRYVRMLVTSHPVAHQRPFYVHKR